MCGGGCGEGGGRDGWACRRELGVDMERGEGEMVKVKMLQMLHLLLQGALLAPQVIDHHGGEEDVFLSSTPVQPPNQVSIYFINFLYMYLINLIKGHFCSPPAETFNLHNVSDGSQEGDADATVAPDPGLATPSHHHRRKAKHTKSWF
jgi:hypothetical protein